MGIEIDAYREQLKREKAKRDETKHQAERQYAWNCYLKSIKSKGYTRLEM